MLHQKNLEVTGFMDNHTFLGAQPPENFIFGDPKDPAIQTAAELVRIQRELGLSLSIHDKNLMTVSAHFKSMTDLLNSPEFIAHLTQDFYLSDASDSQWFMMRLRRGRFSAITLLLIMKIHWMKIINKHASGFDYLVVSYSPGAKEAGVFVAVIPQTGFSPSKIPKYFSGIIGENANDLKEIGKIICFILSKHILNPAQDSLVFVGNHQGFTRVWNEKKVSGVIQFSPPRLLPSALVSSLAPALQSRQYPTCSSAENEDITPILATLFSGSKRLLIALLFRIASWFQFLFVKRDVYADSVLILKPTPAIPSSLLVALMKNTWYDSLEAPPVGPNIKPLRFELETINDGVVVVIDPFAADQVKKAEKGYDLLIQDVCGAAGSSSGVHHIPILISGYADLYIPRDKCCVLNPGNTAITYSPSSVKTTLKRMDADIICRIERGCNDGDLEKVFKEHVDEITAHIPGVIPISKRNTYIMLCTALRMYREFYSPLFAPDFEQEIEAWLISQEQDRQTLNDVICSEFGKILNEKIANGYFKLTLKQEVTLVDKGSHTIVVDREKRCIDVEPADDQEIASNEMKSLNDTDSLTTALYSCDYLPHNSKAEKSVRIAAITSDDIPYPLYVHSINFNLLTPENLQRFDLIDKQMSLFRRDEMPTENFLPLVKTVDGRFAGKMLIYENEENNHFFGTGKSGTGKSWAIAQILCMLRMLGQNVVVLDVSKTYTKEKLYRMLPQDVVDKLFCFIAVGAGQDHIPIDLGALEGCKNLSNKKNVIYRLLATALGKTDPDKSVASRKKKTLQLFLSDYLHDKEGTVDFTDLLSEMERDGRVDTDIIESLFDIFSEIDEMGCDPISWGELFERENRIIVIDTGNEVSDDTHVLLDMLAASLFSWQMLHDSTFLTIAIDELKDQNFAPNSILRSIVSDGRKFHTALIGATQDYFDPRHPQLDAMRQASIKSFCRPGKSGDKIAQELGFDNAMDAGFNKFKSGDVIMGFDAYNKETGGNEPITLRGRVVDFVDTPLYDRFLREYGNVTQPPNDDRTV